jgi:hypothetical protein
VYLVLEYKPLYSEHVFCRPDSLRFRRAYTSSYPLYLLLPSAQALQARPQRYAIAPIRLQASNSPGCLCCTIPTPHPLFALALACLAFRAGDVHATSCINSKERKSEILLLPILQNISLTCHTFAVWGRVRLYFKEPYHLHLH